jgi:hypothetical protein
VETAIRNLYISYICIHTNIRVLLYRLQATDVSSVFSIYVCTNTNTHTHIHIFACIHTHTPIHTKQQRYQRHRRHRCSATLSVSAQAFRSCGPITSCTRRYHYTATVLCVYQCVCVCVCMHVNMYVYIMYDHPTDTSCRYSDTDLQLPILRNRSTTADIETQIYNYRY